MLATENYIWIFRGFLERFLHQNSKVNFSVPVNCSDPSFVQHVVDKHVFLLEANRCL